MVAPTLAVVAAVHALTGAAFLAVARRLSDRPAQGSDRVAARAFVVWWVAMGAYMLLRASLTAYAALTDPSTTVFLAARAVSVPLLSVAVWGLVSHILYVYTGRAGLAWPLALVYLVLGAVFAAAGFWPMPQEVIVERWNVALAGEGQSTLYRIAYGGIAFTILGSALGYLSLLPRIQEPLRRLRVALVGGSILLWVGSGLTAFLNSNDLAKFATLVGLGLLTAGAVLVAHFPPARLRAYLEGRTGPSQAERRERFERRIRGLI